MENQNYLNYFTQNHITLDKENKFFTSWENVPFLREFISYNGSIKKELIHSINFEIEHLKEIRIYIRARRSESVLSLFDLYEFFLDSRVRHFWYESHENILISTTTRSGVYSKLTDLKWYDRRIYKKFVLRKLILNSYSSRGFRISSHLQCEVENLTKTCGIHQITEQGILFRFQNISISKIIKSSKFLKIKLPKLTENCINNQSFSCSIETILRYNKITSDQFNNTNSNDEIFLFVPYYAMEFNEDRKHLEFIDDVNILLNSLYSKLQNNFNFNKKVQI